MNRLGAELLRQRFEEQSHWSQAAAVQSGRQPRTDPDRTELTELGNGVRFYGSEQQHEIVDGRRAIVTLRVVKRLHGGVWERELVREHVEEQG